MIETLKHGIFNSSYIFFSISGWLDQCLTFLSQESRLTSTTPEAVIIAMTLMNIQCWRRLYECLYINVDTGSKMNILHYIVGFAHYFCCGIGYISEAPGFAQHPENSFVKWIHIQPGKYVRTILHKHNKTLFKDFWKSL